MSPAQVDVHPEVQDALMQLERNGQNGAAERLRVLREHAGWAVGVLQRKDSSSGDIDSKPYTGDVTTFAPEQVDELLASLSTNYNEKTRLLRAWYWSKPRELIDNVTLAVELGLLNTKLWPAQLFRDPTSFSVFLAFLAHEPRVNDRQHAALAKLAGAIISDQSCMAPRDIANKLKARAREIGQLLD